MKIKQLIFCVESDSKGIDWIYIKETIDHFFSYGREIKLKPVFTGSKMNIITPKIGRIITNYEKKFTGETVVICCIDADKRNADPVHQKEFDDVKYFCKANGYEFVWFNVDIEDTFLGHCIADSQKEREAEQFRRKKKIQEIDKDRLTKTEVKSNHSSNILSVLRKHLIEKQ